MCLSVCLHKINPHSDTKFICSDPAGGLSTTYLNFILIKPLFSFIENLILSQLSFIYFEWNFFSPAIACNHKFHSTVTTAMAYHNSL